MVTRTEDLGDGGVVWYGAIGSMMCRKALELRGIRPFESLACELRGYRRVHYAPGGMATIWPAPGHVTHAIVHAVTQAELEILEAREPPSQEILAHISTTRPVGLGPTLDGAVIKAFVSVAPWAHAEALPTSRYIGLMVDGARDAFMRPEALRAIAATPAQPRPDPTMFKRFHISGKNAQLQRFRQKSELQGQSRFAVFLNKVIHYEPIEGKPDPRAGLGILDFHGADMTHWMTRQYYNPDFGHPDDNVHNEQYWAWLEDHAVSFLFRGYEQVGFIEEEDESLAQTDARVGARANSKL